jgi:hypothetical protein
LIAKELTVCSIDKNKRKNTGTYQAGEQKNKDTGRFNKRMEKESKQNITPTIGLTKLLMDI